MNRKSFARTSQTPGKTQTINYYNINDAFYLVDLPGYGYAKAGRELAESWGKLIEDYLYSSGVLKQVFLLIDIRHEPSDNDKMMYDWIRSRGFDPVIILTKSDKIKRSQLNKQTEMIRRALKLTDDTVVFTFSAVNKEGRDQITDYIEEICSL